MNETATVTERAIVDTFEAFRAALETEQEQLLAERRALAAFAERVREIHPADASRAAGNFPANGAVAVDAGGGVDQATPAAVRRAYETTVLALPFYDDVYGDDYLESLRAELGPEIAVSLTEANCFSSAAKRATLAATERARTERAALRRLCERERDSVDAAAETLIPLVAELNEIDATPMAEEPFGSLDAYRTRLLAIEQQCEAVVEERQRHLADVRERNRLPPSVPNVSAYFYDSAESNHPVLSLALDVIDDTRRLRRGVERSIARC